MKKKTKIMIGTLVASATVAIGVKAYSEYRKREQQQQEQEIKEIAQQEYK